jgi:hypothetical protein
MEALDQVNDALFLLKHTSIESTKTPYPKGLDLQVEIKSKPAAI